jgi:hypothetical protein
VYRQLLLLAEQRLPQARVLGVTVAATTLARALLRVQARPMPHDRVLIRVGFADPHGLLSRDLTQTILPAAPKSVVRALERLRGHRLITGATSGERDESLNALIALLSQTASFTHAFRDEVERVDLNPVALLLGGGTEVREAAVQVTDAFSRGLS